MPRRSSTERSLVVTLQGHLLYEVFIKVLKNIWKDDIIPPFSGIIGDLKEIEGKNAVRCMDLFNFNIKRVEKGRIKCTFLNDSYEEAKKLGTPLIHWIPFRSGVKCEVVMTNASLAKGVAEDACKALKPNEIIQFQRFGFVRVDEINQKLKAYFSHR